MFTCAHNEATHILANIVADLIHRGIENWMSVTWEEVEGFWKFLRDENIEMDAGEEEWRREQEKERERQEAAMKKMKNLPNDVKSKLGARFQEGQVIWTLFDRKSKLERCKNKRHWSFSDPLKGCLVIVGWKQGRINKISSYILSVAGSAGRHGQAPLGKSFPRGGGGSSTCLTTLNTTTRQAVKSDAIKTVYCRERFN